MENLELIYKLYDILNETEQLKIASLRVPDDAQRVLIELKDATNFQIIVIAADEFI
ncbi:MAG: hypothetical protein R3Y58_06295 [Eubacteriales bacterium]